MSAGPGLWLAIALPVLAAAAPPLPVVHPPAAPPAAAAPLGRPGPPPAAPVWAMDKAGSRVSFKAATTAAAVEGVFKQWDAQVAFDPDNLKGSRLVLVLQTASAVTGNPAWDLTLASPDWLSSKKFPKAMFVSRSIVASGGPGRFTALGELKLRGVSRRASLAFTSVRAGGRLEGVLMIDRSAFRLGPSGVAAAGVSGVPGAVPPMANVLSVKVRLSARKH